MKGIVKYQLGDGYVELRDIVEKPPNSNQVKIEVKVSGICGSDIHIYHGDINIPIYPPVVIGHEFSGIVVEKGTDVKDNIQIGDRVTAEPTVDSCGKCDYCRNGYYNLCNRRKILGYSANGCFAEFCNASLVHKLPENVSFKAGALTELLSCCIHGVLEQTGISVGDFVVITGPGPVGLFSALLAMAEGGIVILCGTSADTHRLNLAEDLGINYTFNIENEDVLNNIKEITQGYGADVVLECSGAAQAASMALKMVRKRGKYTQMGLFGKPIKLDFEQVAFKEIQLTGSISQRSFSWKRALHLMEQEKIPNERLISHEFSLANWESAFEMTGRGQGVKIIFTS